MKEKWIITNKKESFLKLSNAMEENPLILRLLANREIDTLKEAKQFLYGDVEELYDPYLMKDIDKGISIIKDAVENNKKIIIYGDYDCDGVISTTILYKAFKTIGANFDYHVPHREEEGYGMHSGRVKKLKEEGCEVIITCDNGISAFEEIELAKELGMKVVVTDHHDIPKRENEEGQLIPMLPKGDAIINPKRDDCNYPFKKLCGGGIALKFSQGLYEAFGIDKNKFLDLIEFASIATVCDVVDLVDENRIIVKKGLELLNKTKNKGLKELYRLTGLEGKKIEEYHLGFVIGPCVNATGRLETAALSVELLITEDEYKAKDLAKQLYELNIKRQDLTKESAERVMKVVENKYKDDKVIIVYDEEIHESIAGIVAGRVKERYHKPAIVITKGKEMPKASARSIEGYNITEELSKCSEYLYKFGGHPMAAGLSLLEENINPLREKINSICKLTEEDLLPVVRIDSKMHINFLNEDIINILEGLKPFGKGNPSPLFAVKDLMAERLWILGKNKNFFKIRFKSITNGNYIYIEGINFDKFDNFKEEFIENFGENQFDEACSSSYINKKMDITYYPNINEYNGNRNIQLMIKNLRFSGI
ncbi:single-stranded-DNA-specific exonuclease RecJ [Clostridium sp.]|uniref:single-stranded-DNA-specific exonuclease RecJ n=1 Tax=Clostridium sp. TaxID=1506 RepID=UPI00261E74C5|nr:single-stranded-DNA-specific exonuclease RecJ [Clostridium sp.]